MDKNRVENLSLLMFFIGVSILLFFVFAPFLTLLSLAIMFAILFHGLYEKLVRLLRGWRGTAALVLISLMVVFFIVPLFFFGLQVFQEAQNLYTGMHGNEVQYVDVIQGAIEKPVRYFYPGFTFNVNTYVENALGFISNNLESLIYQTAKVFFDTFLMLLALFFFLRDGEKLLVSFIQRSPFGKQMTDVILDTVNSTLKSVIRGTLYVVFIRWLCIGIGFYFFGIPNALLWSSVGGIVGAIPGVGTALVFITGVAYLYLQGHILSAIGLALLGVGTGIIVDSFLTSYFFGKGLEVASIFVLLSILGGTIYFGPLGLILGPLVLSVFLAIVRIYGVIGTKTIART